MAAVRKLQVALRLFLAVVCEARRERSLANRKSLGFGLLFVEFEGADGMQEALGLIEMTRPSQQAQIRAICAHYGDSLSMSETAPLGRRLRLRRSSGAARGTPASGAIHQLPWSHVGGDPFNEKMRKRRLWQAGPAVANLGLSVYAAAPLSGQMLRTGVDSQRAKITGRQIYPNKGDLESRHICTTAKSCYKL